MAIQEIGNKLVVVGEAQFLAAMKRAETATHGFGETSKSSQKPVEGLSASTVALGAVLGTVAVTAALAAGKAMLQFGQDSIKASSDLSETINKVTVVFGSSSAAVLAFGKTSATSLGMSENAALSAAGTYGNLFRSMGMTEKASEGMSIGLVQLAADLASFNNLATGDVLEKLRAGLTGETEPMKALGININQAAIESEALSLGLKKTGEALTTSAKASATYSLILKQTSLAQGDFERTSGGAANQQKILEAQVENLKASIGAGLLPMYVKLLGATNNLVSGMNDLVTAADRARAAFETQEEAARSSTSTFSDYADKLVDIAVNAGTMTKKTGEQEKYLWRLKETYGVLTKEQIASMLATGEINDETADALVYTSEYTKELDALATKRGWVTVAEYNGVRALEASRAKQQEWLDGAENMMSAIPVVSGGMEAIALAASNAAIASDNIAKTMKTLVTDAMQPLTAAILEQKIMATLSGDALLEYARRTGKLDEESYNALVELRNLTTEFDANKNGMIEASEQTTAYWEALAKLKGQVISVDLRADFRDWERALEIADKLKKASGLFGPNGELLFGKPLPGKATGGAVRRGTPYLVGERGAEMFIPYASGTIVSSSALLGAIGSMVAPAGASGAGATAYNNSYSTSNNYQLGVHTSQSPQVVQRSFAMMKLLAG